MIKPVTYQGIFNFAANLYALEVRSRHIDQSKANGFYKGYGNELAATIVSNTITIGTGAFIVQGRINEVVSPETINVTITNGRVGYLVARIETYHPSDENNCSFVVYTGTSFDSIALIQDDVYSAESETVNKVYELPIYSFTMASNQIQNLTKLIEYVGDYEKLKAIADAAAATASQANSTSNAANATANAANAKSDTANTNASAAQTAAANAVATANTANTTSNQTKTYVEQETAAMRGDISAMQQGIIDFENDTATMIDAKHAEMTEEIEQLAEQIGERQGTTVKSGGAAIATLDLDEDIFILDGGDA